MRRLAAAVLLLAAVPAVASAQYTLSTYTGCNIYFCTLVTRTDVVIIDGYDYRFYTDLAFTLRQPIIDAGATLVLGMIRVGDNEWADYEGGLPFAFDATGHRAGDVLSGSGFGSGRTPAGPLGLEAVDLSSDVFHTDGSVTSGAFQDHVENALFVTPEPATLALLATGLVPVALARRRRAHG